MQVFNQSRSKIIRAIFLGVFLLMIFQLFNLQILSKDYEKAAFNNAVFEKTVHPNRGLIYDRKGKAILENVIMHDLMVTPSEVKNIDTAKFCSLLGITKKDFEKKIVDAIVRNGRYRPSVFEDLLSTEKYARVLESIWEFPGFALVERPVRVYPFNAGAHIMGYVGEVDAEIIKRSNGFYKMGDYTGRSGLEAYYESVLMGQRGVSYMVKDNRNRIVGSYMNGQYDIPAHAGRDLVTYIDIEIQQLAEKLLTNKVGSIVAIDPKTGGIIAMASGPSYNPNDLTGSDRRKNYSRLVLDVAGPLLNRAIQGNYEPGSTFKPIGALVALDEGLITPSFGLSCGGAYYGCARPIRCTHSNPGHAGNLRLSIANSCNSYYVHVYRMVLDNKKYGNPKVGYTRWTDYMHNFGLGVRLGVDIPGEGKGLIPDTSTYNKMYRGSWNSCTNLTLGIGQDMMQTTPLQLANAMCIIANKGFYYTPHFVKEIVNQRQEDTILNKFKIKHEVLTGISNQAYEAVIQGMVDVVDYGTARAAKIPGITMAAKTGTAEKFRIIDKKRIPLKDNSMFVCFAPVEDPQIAVAVVVENAGFGSTWAAPMASLIVEKYLTDSLRPERVQKANEIAAANLMPSYLDRLQFIEDSIRAFKWFEMTKDSSYIEKYLPKGRSGNKQQNVPATDRRTTGFFKPEDHVLFNSLTKR